jgi:hypothetical protein
VAVPDQPNGIDLVQGDPLGCWFPADNVTGAPTGELHQGAACRHGTQLSNSEPEFKEEGCKENTATKLKKLYLSN